LVILVVSDGGSTEDMISFLATRAAGAMGK
jgi:hypothetical protein